MSGERISISYPITSDDVFRLIEVIEQERTWHYNVKVLSAIVKMVYYVGLEKMELIKIKVGDIKFVYGEPTEVQVDNEMIELNMNDNEARTFLKEYRAYLKKKYGITRQSLLFPWKDGEPFKDSTLQKCLRSVANKARVDFDGRRLTLSKIRNVGVCRHYRLHGSLSLTANFARCSELETRRILTNKIPSIMNPSPEEDNLEPDDNPWELK
jgi:integrase